MLVEQHRIVQCNAAHQGRHLANKLLCVTIVPYSQSTWRACLTPSLTTNMPCRTVHAGFGQRNSCKSQSRKDVVFGINAGGSSMDYTLRKVKRALRMRHTFSRSSLDPLKLLLAVTKRIAMALIYSWNKDKLENIRKFAITDMKRYPHILMRIPDNRLQKHVWWVKTVTFQIRESSDHVMRLICSTDSCRGAPSRTLSTTGANACAASSSVSAPGTITALLAGPCDKITCIQSRPALLVFTK